MAEKIYDFAVKVGEYQTQNGETKARFENFASMYKGQNGKEPYLVVKRWFNFAGVPCDPNNDCVFAYCFKPRNNANGSNSSNGNNNGSNNGNKGGGFYGTGSGGGGAGGFGDVPNVTDDSTIPF